MAVCRPASNLVSLPAVTGMLCADKFESVDVMSEQVYAHPSLQQLCQVDWPKAHPLAHHRQGLDDQANVLQAQAC